MPTAAHSQQQSILTSKVYGRLYIGGIHTAGNKARSFINHAIVKLSGLVVIIISGLEQLAPQSPPEHSHDSLFYQIRASCRFQ
jgi:hypothetical protein